MRAKYLRKRSWRALTVLLLLQAFPVAGQTQTAPASPPVPQLPAVDWETARELAPGIRCQRWRLNQPRLLSIICLRIDSQTEGIGFHTTSRIEAWELGATETRRQTVRDFLSSSRAAGIPMVVAINADAFSYQSAFNQPDPCDLLGLAVSKGVVVSNPANTPSLIVTKEGALRMEITNEKTDLSAIQVAVSGFAFCLEAGKPVTGGTDLHPRTGFGLSRDSRFLFLMTIDGRQPLSLGATTQELGGLLLQVGAETGINMDGGGSTTLAWWNPQGESSGNGELLNHPVGNGEVWSALKSLTVFQPSERTNGNNFGVSRPPR